MTEDEAKEKWCPFMKGDGGEGESSASCIASACIAWRWRGWRFTSDYGTKRAGRLVDDANSDLRMPPEYSLKRFPLDRVGFCGLAGAPQ